MGKILKILTFFKFIVGADCTKGQFVLNSTESSSFLITTSQFFGPEITKLLLVSEDTKRPKLDQSGLFRPAEVYQQQDERYEEQEKAWNDIRSHFKYI